ncbi:hypothetical protein [Streptomyces sp. ZL-24]|uniref:hypothetical protein n=1 Tax=Streptomyces sp. ZL-24 TaxID=1933029 RepID=UPI001F4DFA8B|nr:hypothetical protein [Streptomyces sp. ZL-24]
MRGTRTAQRRRRTGRRRAGPGRAHRPRTGRRPRTPGRAPGAAADLDRDTEGRRLDDLLAQLHHKATKDPDHKTGTTRTIAACQTAQNTKVQALATQIRKIRTARPARIGWEKAA